MNPLLAGALGLMAIAALTVVGAGLIMAQASPQGTPLGLAPPEPSAKPTKNPTAMHHHFDKRHPHRSTRPKLASPVESPDPAFNGGPNVNKPQEH